MGHLSREVMKRVLVAPPGWWSEPDSQTDGGAPTQVVAGLTASTPGGGPPERALRWPAQGALFTGRHLCPWKTEDVIMCSHEFRCYEAMQEVNG